MVNLKTSFGAFEAKTHFGELLNRVEKGDRILITRHGRVIAHLVPAEAKPLDDLGHLARKALALTAKTQLPKGKTIKDLVNEGRKR
jgi:prevent-host-death family protein